MMKVVSRYPIFLEFEDRLIDLTCVGRVLPQTCDCTIAQLHTPHLHIITTVYKKPERKFAKTLTFGTESV